MSIENLFRAFGQAFGEAMAENGKFKFDFDGSGWKGAKWKDGGWDEDEWDTLDSLDLEGAAPEALKIALSRSDTVKVKKGKKLAIKVEGDDSDGLRFRLTEDTLRIMRRGGSSGDTVIRVTMPAPRKIAIGGSGRVESETLAADAQLAIGGSGHINVAKAKGESLSVKIGGSGTVEASGSVAKLDLAIGGSGKLVAPELEVEEASIRIGGSGKARFASDGVVDAKVGGVGDIVVIGQPRCSLKAGGAGRIRCIPRDGTDNTDDDDFGPEVVTA